MSMCLMSLLDNLKGDLKSLHPQDRLSASARLLGRPSLVSNREYRMTFGQWRRGVNL